jgi:hypothetical protein
MARHSRQQYVGSWGRTLKKALKCKELPVNLKEWRAIAEDRSEWRSRTYSEPMPPSENWSYSVHESKDEHCITQKVNQPSQTFLEDSSKRSFVVLIFVSLRLGSTIQSSLGQSADRRRTQSRHFLLIIDSTEFVRVKDQNCTTHEDTQPCQTCSPEDASIHT